MDFKEYQKAFNFALSEFSARDVLSHYQLPNADELHMMVCGYSRYVFGDKILFDAAESIDYVKYEKELWKQERLE